MISNIGAERSSKRSHDHVDADIEPGVSSQHPPKEISGQIDSEDEMNTSLHLAIEATHEAIESTTEAGESPQQATRRSYSPDKVESEVGNSSKRPCLEERRLLDPRGFGCMQRTVSPYATTYPSPTRDFTSSNYGDSPSAPKAIYPPSLDYNPRIVLHPKPRRQKYAPSASIPSSLLPTFHPSGPNQTRPTFNQLATDGQQGMKVLFLIDHATKGDAIHHNLKPFFPSPSSSSELKLLMSKYRSDRSHFQNRYFAKARTICAHLTSRREFLELDTEMGELGSSRASRLAYFSEKCSKVHLATLYSHLASAVDIAKILLARTPNDKAFIKLMTQVFIHSMEDLWCFEFHPSKQDLPAKRDKENKEDLYSRFRVLTDREDGLPAAKDLPGYLEVPLKANFPRYVLFG